MLWSHSQTPIPPVGTCTGGLQTDIGVMFAYLHVGDIAVLEDCHGSKGTGPCIWNRNTITASTMISVTSVAISVFWHPIPKTVIRETVKYQMLQKQVRKMSGNAGFVRSDISQYP